MALALSRLALAAAALAIGGCSQNGGYRLSWDFYTTSAGGPIQSAAVGCGQHGVDSIFAQGADETGDVIQVTAICPPGTFTGTAPNGLWTFTFQMFDVRGTELVLVKQIPLSSKMMMQPAAQPIASEGAVAVFPVTFVPQAACGDGIDNDGDGLVDTAGTECDAGSAGRWTAGRAPRTAVPREHGTAASRACRTPAQGERGTVGRRRAGQRKRWSAGWRLVGSARMTRRPAPRARLR